MMPVVEGGFQTSWRQQNKIQIVMSRPNENYDCMLKNQLILISWPFWCANRYVNRCNTNTLFTCLLYKDFIVTYSDAGQHILLPLVVIQNMTT